MREIGGLKRRKEAGRWLVLRKGWREGGGLDRRKEGGR